MDGDLPCGAIERTVRSDVELLITAHPMGESLAELAYSNARHLDDPKLAQMARAGLSRELRETLIELARLGVDDDDDLDATLSRPELPSSVRDLPES